jgi:hypothetical protein
VPVRSSGAGTFARWAIGGFLLLLGVLVAGIAVADWCAAVVAVGFVILGAVSAVGHIRRGRAELIPVGLAGFLSGMVSGWLVGAVLGGWFAFRNWTTGPG